MEERHTAVVGVAVFGHHHYAGDALVQPVYRMKDAIAQIVGHRAGHRYRFLRQRRRVDGDSGGLVEDQQVFILPQDVQGVVHRNDGTADRRYVGDICGQNVAGFYCGPHCHRVTVEQNGVFPPLEGFQQGGGEVHLLPQQAPHRTAGQIRRDGQSQNTHEHSSTK